ncbi:MAG TPA: MoxR family ATPase [Candidatus Korarchaeota archaeon]|nr:MoxR family ATPase [Candidatus Korarchaeota archaeon]
MECKIEEKGSERVGIMGIDEEVQKIKEKYGIVGRNSEIRKILMAIKAGKHVLLEGSVGIGKTLMARSIAEHLKRGFIRVDGDERLTEGKFIGYWDPPMVINKGYVKEAFIEGPLTRAALSGSVLFINELNRLSESAQNALLPVMDEGIISIPHFGTLKAKKEFIIIATQNPEESIGVTRLSEALKDRFVLVRLDYQSEEEEKEIVRQRAGVNKDGIVSYSVKIVRKTRKDPNIRRGASVRAAIDMALLAKTYGRELSPEDWLEIALMILPERIDIREDLKPRRDEIIRRIVEKVLGEEVVEENFLFLRGQEPR